MVILSGSVPTVAEMQSSWTDYQRDKGNESYTICVFVETRAAEIDAK